MAANTISDMAREFGLTYRALRFYEERGLLRPVRQGKARYYSDADKLRLKLIVEAKALGFSLTEMIGLLPGWAEAGAVTLTPAQIDAQLKHLYRRSEETDEAIESLERMRREREVA